MREQLEPVRKRRLPVLLWAPPLRPDMLQAMEQYGFLPEWQRLAAKVGEIAPFVDLTTTRGLNGTTFSFSDPSHHMNGRLILEHLVVSAAAQLPQLGAGFVPPGVRAR